MTTATETAPVEALILAGEGYSLTISPDAEQAKATLIKHSALIVEVNDAPSTEAARGQLKKLADMRILVEKSRTKIKAPVLDVGKDIDSKAKAFVGPIEAEEKRLAGLIGAYAAKLEKELREALRKQQEEERKRLAEEAEAKRKAEEAAAQAEAARKAAEEAAFADDDADLDAAKEAQAKAEAEAKAAAEAKAEADRKAEEAHRLTLAAPVPEKVEGVKFEPEYELVDIHTLYAAFPSFVELTPKRSVILAAIKRHIDGHGGELPTIPGLTVTKKPVVRGK